MYIWSDPMKYMSKTYLMLCNPSLICPFSFYKLIMNNKTISIPIHHCGTLYIEITKAGELKCRKF